MNRRLCRRLPWRWPRRRRGARREDLLQIYREAQRRIRRSPPRARSGRRRRSACRRRARRCCPASSAQGQANVNYYDAQLNARPARSRLAELRTTATSRSRRRSRCTARRTWSRSTRRSEQVDAGRLHARASRSRTSSSASTVAYFDVLLAEFNVELAEQQKIAVSEQLAQAKRNFEVGVATITDTNEAQAKYDSIVATRSRRATTSTTGARRCARSSAARRAT